MEGQDNEKRERREEIFSQVLRAGKRTYFFDVKVTSADDYYLTITESKKRFDNRQGKPFYEKHKIFLYKEDFDNFMDSFLKTVEFIKVEKPGIERRPLREEGKWESQNKQDPAKQESKDTGEISAENFSNVDFEDLGTENEKKEEKPEE
ncbi:MAG: DUF3276 family protein [Bacteroidales bacterium]|nr:DUF3276 family protein [Bacteroidales bacterium]